MKMTIDILDYIKDGGFLGYLNNDRVPQKK